MKDACPGLELPADLPINEKQTSLFMTRLRKQDPDAPIRNFPGSYDSMTPGGIGVANARKMGRLPFPAEELRRWLAENRGQIVTRNDGLRYVLSHDPNADELWRLGANSEIDEVWKAKLTHDGKVITWSPGGLFAKPHRHLIGYALAMYPTGQRHPAYILSDGLAESQQPIVLSPWGRPETLRLAADGGFTGAAPDGRAVAGRWWWSRGELNLRFEGEAETLLIGWRDLYERLRQARAKGR